MTVVGVILLLGAPQTGDVAKAAPPAPSYVWEKLVERAPYPTSYNYPVHAARDGTFVALHPQGTWRTRDGARWRKTALPARVLNSAYMNYVEHAGASWALGRHSGDYQRFSIDPVILRTTDHERWETVGRASGFPQRVFTAAVSFRGALWLIGGHDGAAASAEVWRSADGLAWTRVTARAPWSARAGAKTIVFRGRLFVIGGGMVDGPTANDVWSTGDGVVWRRETASIAPEEPVGFAPIVFDDQIWLVGANRSGRFRSQMLVSADGRTWRPVEAPWSPRGGIATWTDGQSLFVTGGKYSVERNGETTFVYSNDVWRMRRAR